MRKKQTLKSLTAVLLSAALLSVSGCGSKGSENNSKTESSAVSAQTSQESSETSKVSGTSETSETSKVSGTSETSETSKVSGTSETSETSKVSGTSETSENSKSSDTSETSDATNELLSDISSVLPQTQNMVLSDYAVTDDQNILLLYADITSSKPYFSLYQANVRDKSLQTITEKQETTLNIRTKQPHSLVIADADRQIVVDKAEGTFYYLPEKETAQLDMEVYFEDPSTITDCFMMNGKLCCINIYGQLFQIDEKDGEHIPSYVNYPPLAYQFDSLAEIRNGSEIIIRMTSERERVPEDIYIASKPLTYQNTQYTAENIQQETVCAVSENYKAVLNDTNLILRTKDNKEYTYDLSAIPECLDAVKNNASALHISTDAVSDGILYFTAALADGTEKLFSWHFSAESAQDFTPAVFNECEIPPITREDTETLKKQFEEEFGITVHIYDDIHKNFPYYNVEPLTNDTYVYDGLRTFQQVCRNYPKGIFRQIHLYDNDGLNLFLVDNITRISSDLNTDPAGFVAQIDLVQIASERTDRSVCYHELTHILYRQIRHNGGEEDVSANFDVFNPEGFVYGEQTVEYTPLDPENKDYDSIYFASNYGKSNSNEDMANMMDQLMGPYMPSNYLKGVHIYAKYRYVFNLFRKYFDTTGWDETLTWEKRLDYGKNADSQ